MRKKLTILLILVFVLVTGELAREKAGYIVRRRTLEASYWQIDKQMRAEGGLNKKDITKMLGAPEKNSPQPAGEMWSWSALTYQGRLWRLLPGQANGHYVLDVEFDPEGQVINVYSLTN